MKEFLDQLNTIWLTITELPLTLGNLGLIALICLLVALPLGVVQGFRRLRFTHLVLALVVCVPGVYVLRDLIYEVNIAVENKLDFPYIDVAMNVLGYGLPFVLAIVIILLLRVKRVFLLAPAMLLVAAGATLTIYNSFSVQEDISYANQLHMEELARQDRIAKMEEVKSENVSRALSAEETMIDRMDLGGKNQEEADRILAAVNQGLDAQAQGTSYAYRNRGVQQRNPDSRADNADQIASDFKDVEQAVAAEQARKVLPIETANRANAMLDYLLFAARFIGLLVLCMGILEYFRRVCEPMAPLFPLPIFKKWMEYIFHRPRSIFLRAENELSLRRLMCWAVGKGESFVYIGPENLWPERRMRRWPFITFIPVQQWCPGDVDYDPEMIAESVWFNRLNAVVLDKKQNSSFLDAFIQIMQVREQCKAGNTGKMNLVWRVTTDPTPALVNELFKVCKKVDVKLWIIGDVQLPPELEDQFDLVVNERELKTVPKSRVPKLEPQPRYVDMKPVRRRVSMKMPSHRFINEPHSYVESSGRAEAEL